MDIITLDEEYCGNCNSYTGLIGLVGSGLCPRCRAEISDDDGTEDELPYLEISPLALPRHEKPKRGEEE